MLMQFSTDDFFINMKTTSVSIKNCSASFNMKSKKNVKDREKRKSVATYEKNELHNNNEKGSPNKDSSIRKYAGIGPESVALYSEQSTFEHLSKEVYCGLAEDLSYKLRYIIHDALIKARLSGRNHILSSDIDATFNDLNIDKIYGATAAPNWIVLGDQNCYYLEDPIVNLVDVAEQDCSYMQPGDVVLIKKWLPDNRDSKALKNYFETMCLAIVSNDMVSRNFALNDIRTNNFIGPIVKWFYNFGYFLLSKDITYDCLTLSALNLINSLERNSVAPLCVTEKQLKLLVRLILQRLLRTLTTTEVLKPICSILALLCQRLPIRELVITKLNQKIPEAKENFTLPVLHILNALGLDAIQEIFSPDMDFILLRVQHGHPDLTSAVLETYSILCRHYAESETVHEKFYSFFGDTLCPFWNYNNPRLPERIESNWFNIKLQLLRSRKKLPYTNKQARKYHIRDLFPDYNDDLYDCKLNAYGNGDYLDKGNAYRCICKAGWENALCSIHAADSSLACQSNGSSIDKILDFQCDCRKWKGKTSQIKVNHCEHCPGRNYQDVGSTFICRCPQGWEAVQHTRLGDSINDRKNKISFKLTKANKAKGFASDLIESLMKVESYSIEAPEITLLSEFMDSTQKHIIIGKRTLLISSFRQLKYRDSTINHCYDHSLKYYNL